MNTRVTVFGGSQPKPGDPVYQDALHLGKLLAQRVIPCSVVVILAPWKHFRVVQLKRVGM